MSPIPQLIGAGNNSKGKIRRIKCIDFMTYADIEVYPIDKLNIIIGPNGSGKSTIVLAIILGLGGNAKVAGRAPQLSEYIKSGCDSACIEIELKHGSESDVIKRYIYSNNKSSWLINESASTHHEVERKVKYYQIYVDNLCQVLPQEKIASFAKMNDSERLDSTLKAVGNGKLYEDYCSLKDSKSTMESNTRDVRSLKDKLEKEIQLNERLRVEVNNIKEKKILMDNVKLCLQKMTWEMYYHQLYNFTKVRKMKSVLIEKCKHHRKRILPLKQKHNHIMKILNVPKREFEKRLAASVNILHNRSKVQQYLLDMTKSISGKSGNSDRNTILLQCARLQLSMFQNDRKELQEKHSAFGDLESQLREILRNIDRERDTFRDIERKKNSFSSRLESNKNVLRATENELARSGDDTQRQNMIRNINPDIVELQSWLQGNKDMFQDIVDGPICCCIKIKDPKMAKYVEAVIPRKDLLAFICASASDSILLMRKTKEMNLRVNVITRPQGTSSNRKQKYHINEISNMGFQCYLKDLIEAPQFIMDYFVNNYDVENIPIGNRTTDELAEKIQNQIDLFFSDNTRFSSTKSRYTGERILRAGKIGDAYLLKKNEEAERRLRNLTLRKQELISTVQREKCEYERYSVLITEQENKLDDLYNKKASLEKIRNDQRDVEEKLEAINRNIMQYKEEEKKLNSEIARSARESESLREKFFLIHRLIIEMTKEVWIQREKAIEAMANMREFEKIAKETLDKLDKIRRKAEPTVRLFMDVQHHEKYWARALQKFKKIALASTDGIKPNRNTFSKFKEFSKLSNELPVLREQLSKYKAKIRCLISAGGEQEDEILKEFNDRDDLIRKYQNAYDSLDKSKNSYVNHIRQVNEQWIPSMNELIACINRNFGKFFADMNCAGEVSLSTGNGQDDFENYGITIKVKFRQEQPLSVLDSRTQSGGERAVTTAVYLLSLQELTSVPFRCIDEINQGMDEQNERRIFSLLASVVSEKNSPQYFLITPKVLPKLKYTKDMQIMCPFNGSITMTQDEYLQLHQSYAA